MTPFLDLFSGSLARTLLVTGLSTEQLAQKSQIPLELIQNLLLMRSPQLSFVDACCLAHAAGFSLDQIAGLANPQQTELDSKVRAQALPLDKRLSFLEIDPAWGNNAEPLFSPDTSIQQMSTLIAQAMPEEKRLSWNEYALEQEQHPFEPDDTLKGSQIAQAWAQHSGMGFRQETFDLYVSQLDSLPSPAVAQAFLWINSKLFPLDLGPGHRWLEYGFEVANLISTGTWEQEAPRIEQDLLQSVSWLRHRLEHLASEGS